MNGTNNDFFRKFKALGDETRFKIFSLLLDHDICVRGISHRLKISEPSVSQHLKVLRECGLVHGEKRGYWVHYSVNYEEITELIHAFGNFVNPKKPTKQLPIGDETRTRRKKTSQCSIKETIKCPNNKGGKKK